MMETRTDNTVLTNGIIMNGKFFPKLSSICNGVLPRDLPKSLPILIDVNVNN